MSATRALSLDEQTALSETLRNPRDRLFFWIGIYTGFRIREMLSLRLGNVWIDGRPATEITVAPRNLKGGRRNRSRTVPVAPELQAAIQNYVTGCYGGRPVPREAPLFMSREGDNAPISREHAWRILKTAARQLGSSNRVATHSMRKTFARSIFDQSGHDLILTQRALGHRDITTTAKYLESTGDEVQQAVLRIRGPLQPAPLSSQAQEMRAALAAGVPTARGLSAPAEAGREKEEAAAVS